MLARSISARAFQSRLGPGLAQAQVRRLSLAAQPATRAASKRPALLNPILLGGGASISTRNISFSPFSKGSAPAASTEQAFNPALEQQLTDAADKATEAVSSVASSAAETASSVADTAASTAANVSSAVHHAPEHITANTPDGQFHSDPTPLLPQPPANAQTPTLEDLVTNSGLPLQDVLNSPEAIHAAVKVSDLKLIGLDHGMFSLPGWVRDALLGMHDITGLPWWGSIVALTLALRLCMMPLVVRNMRHGARMAAVGPQMNGLMKRLTDAKKAGDQTSMMIAQKNLVTLMKEHDVSPFRSFLLPLFQVPFFLSMFMALRKLATLPFPQLKEGGFSWVTDLTVPDPFYILPVTSIAFQIMVLKLGADGAGTTANNPKSQRQMAHLRNVMIVLSPAFVSFTSTFPAAVLFYWTSTNLITLIQSTIFRMPAVRKVLGLDAAKALPPPPSDVAIDTNPGLRDTWNAFRGMMDNAFEKARAKQAEDNARKDRANERKRNMGEGTSKLAERVSEPAAQAEAAAAEAAAAAAAAEAEVESQQLTREEQKAARIRAAREKRLQK